VTIALVTLCLYAIIVVVFLLAGRRVAAREIAMLVPNLVRLFADLFRDPHVPRSAKIVTAAGLAWLAFPIDLLPDFLPVIGPLDDAIIAALVLRYLVRRAGRAPIEAHWRGDQATLRLLLRVAGLSGSPPTP
jgi:uncharacterized membrane protein YkvA (DUF1232 family)